MSVRRAAVAIAAAALLAGLVWVMGDALDALNVPPDPMEPKFEERQVLEPPPLVEPVPDLAARRSFWLRMLITGDQADVDWAKTQIRRDGDPGRAAVLEAAKRTVRSNPAFVQQALDILLESPRGDCFPLAREVLGSRDPHGVNRALLLLARLGPEAAPVVDELATLAVEREYPIPQYAMTALANIGTDSAREAATDAVGRMDAGQRAFGYVALAEFGGAEVIAFMRQAFDVETDPLAKLAAAEGLVRAGDRSTVPWLRQELERADMGTPYYDGTLRVLARAKDEEALRRYLKVATDKLESDKRRANALERVRDYPLDVLLTPLGEVLRDRNTIEARVPAWEILIRKDAPGRLDDLEALLFAPGPGGAGDRRVAALVLGRLRRPESAPALIDSLGRLAPDEREERGLYHRALAMTGALEAAPVIARAIAGDTSGFGTGGVAFDISTVFGELTQEFRAELGVHVRRALDGKFGQPAGAGLQTLLMATPICCGSEAAEIVEIYVDHDERQIREAAVTALAFVGRRDSLIVLRRAWKRPQDDLLRARMADTIEKLQYVAE